MPNTPFILQGIITDLDKSTALADCTVFVKNKTASGGTFATTNSSGVYVLDLANMNNGWTVGDVISVKIRKENKCRVYDLTITQAMADTGGFALNLSIYGVRQHVFDTLFGLYEDNLPPSFLDNDKTSRVVWKVTSSMPEDTPEFPVIIIHPAKITNRLINLDSSQEDDEIVVETEFFSRARFGKVTIDSARDYMESVLKTNQSVLNYAGLYFRQEFIDDSTVGMLIFNDQKYNLANQILSFKWSP